MNQRMHNLSKWSFLREGLTLFYENPRPRTVILEVNCPEEVRFYVLQDPDDLERDREKVEDEEAGRTPRPGQDAVDEEYETPTEDGRTVTFLARCIGRDRLEFAVDGPFSLMAEGGSAYVFTADSQDISTRLVSPVIFTRLATRRERNPQLELIEYQAKLNLERRMQQLEVEIERRLADKVNRYAEPRRVRKLVEQPDREQSEPEGAGGRPSSPEGNDGEDESEGGAGKPARKKRAAAPSGDD